MEETADGVHQHSVGGSGVETAGLLERQDPLHPAVAFGTRRPQGPFPPQDATPQGSLGPVVRRLDAVLGKKDPQRVHLPQQAAGEPSGVIRSVMILLNQLAEPSVPGPPLSTRGWGRGHMTQTLQLRQRPRTTRRQLGVLALRQAPRRPDEVRQACLPRLHPVLVHAVAVTDQDACPVVDEGCEGFFGPVGMNHVERHPLTGHHPEPMQGMHTEPRGFIDIVDRGLPCLRRYRHIIRLDGLGYPIEDLLDGPQADRHLQHRGAKGLHYAAAVAVCPCQLAHERTEPWPIAGGMLGGHLCGVPGATVRTPAVMQHTVRHLHRDGRQLDHLVRVIGRG